MSDTAQRSSAQHQRSEDHRQPGVRVYRGPTHRWVLLARIDLSQDQAEAYAVHHTGTMPDADPTEVIGPCCVVCEADWANAPETCHG